MPYNEMYLSAARACDRQLDQTQTAPRSGLNQTSLCAMEILAGSASLRGALETNNSTFQICHIRSQSSVFMIHPE